MRQSTVHGLFRSLLKPVLCGAAALVLAGASGCAETQKKADPPPPRYPTLPPRENLPAFMKGTVYEYADAGNLGPYPVSSFGLVVGLSGTGNNTGTPLAVRNYIRDEMVKHGLGSQDDRLKKYVPERVLEDRSTAVVEVYGMLPPGAREGQRMDLYVRAIDGSQTTSLSRGSLWQTDLRVRGADPLNPRGSINIYGKAKGPVFVNPVYAGNATDQPGARASLRTGMILNGGFVTHDRPIWLRVRAPQLSLTRAIEARIDQRYENLEVARTKDEAIVNTFVPTSFNGDWEHFVGVATHLYMNNAPGFGSVKARELAEEAVKPNAPLKDISYCWEGIGGEALPFVQPLYAHASADVAFAAARAGLFIRDAAAEEAMLMMATRDDHPFQLNAVRALGALPPSRRLERMLTQVLSSKNPLARVAAYETLVSHGSPTIDSQEVGESFVLDLVPARGEPLVYATRSGVPRIAIFGPGLTLNTPIVFSALDNQLTITTPPDGRGVTVFDRTTPKIGGVQARMQPQLHEIVWRLGGGIPDDGFQFGYSDLVAVLKSLADGKYVAANFLLQDSPALQDAIEDAPPLPDPVVRPAETEAPAGTADGKLSAALRPQQ